MTQKKSALRGIIQSLGLVFGDIGTSPIYTLTVIYLLMPKPVTDEHVVGVLSLIVWTSRPRTSAGRRSRSSRS